jgi:hypothetical protein
MIWDGISLEDWDWMPLSTDIRSESESAVSWRLLVSGPKALVLLMDSMALNLSLT